MFKVISVQHRQGRFVLSEKYATKRERSRSYVGSDRSAQSIKRTQVVSADLCTNDSTVLLRFPYYTTHMWNHHVRVTKIYLQWKVSNAARWSVCCHNTVTSGRLCLPAKANMSFLLSPYYQPGFWTYGAYNRNTTFHWCCLNDRHQTLEWDYKKRPRQVVTFKSPSKPSHNSTDIRT